MNHWVDKGHTVLYVNYEEAVALWERTLFMQVAKTNVYAARKMSASSREYYTEIFRETMERWGDRFIVRHDPDSPYFEDLEQWMRDIIGHNDNLPEVVIIDTIQSMFTKGAGAKPRWAQYEEMMVRLEKLARDMNCVMILTAQENTNRMKEKREVVQQSDAGGSIAILQKASIGLFITQKRTATGDDSEDETVMQLQIPKNRITGTRFNYDPPLVRYDDDTKSYYPWGVDVGAAGEGGVVVMSSDLYE
jgi:replicative DNA helicase